MSKEYRQVAGKLGVKYLFGRWGVSMYSQAPDGPKQWKVKLVPLDGWSFDVHHIKQALVDDGWSVNAKPEKEKE